MDDRISSWSIDRSELVDNKWESDYEVIILGEMHVKSFGYRDYDITLRMVAQSGLTVMYHFKTEDDKVIVDEDK